MIDPGNFSTMQNNVRNIDAILITHEHADHVALDSLKEIVKNNPKARIFTNKSVQKMLKEQGITAEILGHRQKTEVNGVSIEGFGEKHAEIHSSIPVIENTGYFIADRFFYPGDAFVMPDKKVEILALPAAAPWMKISEGIDYALNIKPNICFPVHDGMLKTIGYGAAHGLPGRLLPLAGVQFIVLEEGKEYREF